MIIDRFPFRQIISIQVGSSEPNWIVNLKKSIASQLQLDITGVRAVSSGPVTPSPADLNSAITTFEDGLNGDCSTVIQVNRLPTYQVYETDAFDFGSFDTVCKGSNVYEVVKTTDFNRCLNSSVFHSVTPSNYMCTLGRAQCGDAMVVNIEHRRETIVTNNARSITWLLNSIIFPNEF